MRKVLIIAFALLYFLPGKLSAQFNSDNSVVYQNWKMVGESPTHYEVAARVVKCHPDSAVQIHLELFNEGVGSQICNFKITFANPLTNEKITKDITQTLAVGEMLKPSCGNSDKQFLRFNLPDGWNPETVAFTVTFIP